MSLADQQWCPTSVQVTVLQARGLRTKGKSGTNDAYALIQVGKEKYQTSVVEKSVAPVWKEEASFDLPPLLLQGGGGGGGGKERDTLHVQVLHRALVGPDKLLGQAVINLLQLSEDKSRSKTEWFKLLDKTGKPDKDRGEVFLDIQFMRNNMTGSMFDLSAAGKSRSRLGKFKDKVRGKKKELDSSSGVAPSLTQVLTDSEEEDGYGGGEAGAGKDEKSKQHKRMSLFSSKSNLQRNMSQSMSVLPAKNSSLTGSQSSGLNVDSSEGKKKFKFKIHKHSSSTDSKDSTSGQQKQDQSNLCINGSHVYCEEAAPRTSRSGSNFSLSSSGRGSMEDVPGNSSPSVDSLKAVRKYTPWVEEEEEKDDSIEDLRTGEEEKAKLEKDVREEEEAIRKQQEELERLAREKLRSDEEERIRKEEKERQMWEEEKRRVLDEEQKRCRAEMIKKEEEMAQEWRRQEEEQKLAEEQRRLKEEEERRIEEEKVRREQERAEERRKKEQENKQREEEERHKKEEMRIEEEKAREKEHARLMAEKRLEEERIEAEEKFRKVEEERIKMEEEMKRKEDEENLAKKRELEEEERRREEQEKMQMEEDRKIKEEEERLRRHELERLAKEKLRQEEEERRMIEERAKRKEEELIQKEKMRQEEEERRQKEEEEERKRQEELERLAKEKLRREEEERRMIEEQAKREEEEMIQKEKMRQEEEKRRQKEEEEERKRRQEELERLAKEKLRREEEERRKIEEQAIREEEERIQKEKMRQEEKEKKERVEEEKRKEEEERIKNEEQEKLKNEARKREEEERIKEEKHREEEMEKKRIEEDRIRREERAEKERWEEEERKREKLAKEKKENKMRVEQKSVGPKVKLRVPIEITSTNPFDDNFSSPEETPTSPEAKTDHQRCQTAVSPVGSLSVSINEKDPINAQREKRAAPKPPGRNQPERQRQEEEETSAQHLSQINKQSKDKNVITVSVAPQRSVQMIAPLNRRSKDLKNTRSETENDSTKEETIKNNKRPAPAIPCTAEDKLHRGVVEMKEDRDVHGLNPFEDDDEDENVLTVQDDVTSGKTDPVHWPPVKSQTADRDAGKIKSSKILQAPLPPAPPDTPPSSKISQTHDKSKVSDDFGATAPSKACDPQEVKGYAQVHQNPNKESKPTVTVAGVKEEGPLASSRRLQPVKPLNPLEQQSDFPTKVGNDNKATGLDCNGVQHNTNVGTGRSGPYSQLTREELIALLLKHESQLSERDKKISELEQYIDNLLVRVIEEQPSILLSLSSLKKVA